MILVSACFVGYKCRYDGRDNSRPDIIELARDGKVIPVCPELLGGLTTPRKPCEIVHGDGRDVLFNGARVIDIDGADATRAFVLGAQRSLELCREHGVGLALLKSKSPSCGCGMIYDGSFSGVLRSGDGVTSALLKDNGVSVQAVD